MTTPSRAPCCSPNLAVEAFEGALHLLFGEIVASLDVEAEAAQFVGHRARVASRLRQRGIRARIGGVADDQGYTGALRKDRTGRKARNEAEE